MGQRALELGRRRHLAGEVALELLVVAGDDLLDQLVVATVLLVEHLFGEGFGVVASVGLVLEALVAEHVGDPVELLLFAERQLERHESGAEARRHLGEHPAEVGTRLVLLGHEDESGDAELGALRPAASVPTSTPSTALTTSEGEVGDGQRGVDVAGEVGVARRVDQVDLAGLATVVAAPLERSERKGQGHRPLWPPRARCRRPSCHLPLGPARATTPARTSRASTSVVFPLPPWPMTATLRMLSVDGWFKVRPPRWFPAPRPDSSEQAGGAEL